MTRTLIFGGTGSLGRKLIDRLLPMSDSEVAVYSRDEAKHWTIRNEMQAASRVHDPDRLRFYVGDVRDARRITDVIRHYDPHRVIIAAALKHVDTCELSPNESVLTNLVGTQNVIDAVNSRHNAAGPCTVLFVSTDKACSPVNVYGMCKAISERIVTSQKSSGMKNVRYLVVRYGNVLESRGSIIPLFKHQSENMDYLTVTDPEMTRFVMTLDDSVDLILKAFDVGQNGTTWIPRLPSMRIGDLATLFSERSGKPVKVIGPRPGEKRNEDLINESESMRTTCFDDFYVIGPASEVGTGERFTYTSADSVMSKDQLKAHLTKLGIFNEFLDRLKHMTIEEIMTNRRS